MSILRDALNGYLAMRRSLGFKLYCDGIGLSSFVSFMEEARADYITISQALAWAQMPVSAQPARWAARLTFVRGFARYCSLIDARTEVPPPGLLPFDHQRPAPYLFTDENIRDLLEASLLLQAKDGLRNHTFYCLLGLLSVTGLRISEALGLLLEDVDLDEDVLTIRTSKFGKSRLVPLHASTVAVLKDYRERREKFLAGRQFVHWFANPRGERLRYAAASETFCRLIKHIGLHEQNGKRKPRLHDLRHSFAMATLVKWYRDGEDIERRLPVLSAYLGHVAVSDTYWYLSASPELLAEARGRLEQRWGKAS